MYALRKSDASRGMRRLLGIVGLGVSMAAGLMAALIAPSAHAIVTANGSSPALPSGLSLDGVGRLSNGCSAVLLGGGEWVLASAHCAAGVGDTVTFAGGAVGTVAQTFIAPGYTDAAVNDLSLSRLVTPVAVGGYSIGPSPVFPAAVVLAGYGAGGSGATGATLAGGVLRWGVNEYDELLADDPPAVYGGKVASYDFDSGLVADSHMGGLGLGAGEAGLAAGDSGGPSFALVSGQWLLVGIHVAVDDTLGYGYGGISYDMLTAPYAPWVAQVTAVPEPQALLLLAAGMLMLAGLRQSARISRLAWAAWARPRGYRTSRASR